MSLEGVDKEALFSIEVEHCIYAKMKELGVFEGDYSIVRCGDPLVPEFRVYDHGDGSVKVDGQIQLTGKGLSLLAHDAGTDKRLGKLLGEAQRPARARLQRRITLALEKTCSQARMYDFSISSACATFLPANKDDCTEEEHAWIVEVAKNTLEGMVKRGIKDAEALRISVCT